MPFAPFRLLRLLRRVVHSKATLHMSLSAEERKQLLEPLFANGWTMVEGRDAIKKNFQFKNFNEVDVTLSSHDVNGLSQRDVKLAKFMDKAST